MNILLALTLLAPTPWVTSNHSIQIGDHRLQYQAAEGAIPVTDEKGNEEAQIGFTSYTVTGADRPITFVWNGGPGGSSIILHMYAVGPRVFERSSDDAKATFRMVDNPDTLLAQSDLVFVDPVGTGFSRPARSDDKSFFGVKGDTSSLAQFIEKYLSAAHREQSPTFLFGESYGTFRNAAVAYKLKDSKVNLRGLCLISNAIRFDILIGKSDNDLYYEAYLPSYTATAAYYKKLKPEWNNDPNRAIAEARKFADGEYLVALAQGDTLSKAQLHKVAAKMSDLTGLDVKYLESRRLRIDDDAFRQNLLRGDGKVLGKDSTTTDWAFNPITKNAVACYTDYLKKELGYQSNAEYLPLSMAVNFAWDYGKALQGFPDQTDNLRYVLNHNPKLKVFAAQGKYDFTTPFSGAAYTFWHLGLDEGVKDNWELHIYNGGHMMYMFPGTRAKLHADLAAFYAKVLAPSVPSAIPPSRSRD